MNLLAAARPRSVGAGLEGGGKGVRFPAAKLAATASYRSVPQANQRPVASQRQYAPTRGQLMSHDFARCSREEIAK